MIASAQLTNTKVFSFIAVLVLKLLSRKDLFIEKLTDLLTEKTRETVKK